MAERLGFPRPDPTLIATAISEIARNIVVHVGQGEIVLRPFEDADRYGVVVIASDAGRASATSRRPFATTTADRGGLGLGLPGRPAADGRLRGRVGRRRRHDGDDDGSGGTATSSRACARSAAGVPERAPRAAGRVGRGHAVPARRGDERRSRGRHASCRRARSWPASTGSGTAARPPAPLAGPPRSCARARARTSSGSSALPRRPAGHARGSDQPRLRLARRERGMTWLGVGNVEGRVLSADPSATRPKGSLALGSGVPGHELPAVRTATLDVRPGDVLVLATDGIASAFADSLDISGLDPGDQRAHPGRPLEALGRRPRGGGPLPRRAAVSAAGTGAGRSERRTRPRSATICATRREASLRVAYELAREAVSRRLSVLDLAVAHQEALLSALAGASGAGGGPARDAARPVTSSSRASPRSRWSSAASARPGEAALLERRQTELSRQLSTFLADASLALDAYDSLEEMLRLVAEQARELVGADCCVATVAAGGPAPDRRSGLLLARPTGAGRRSSGGSTCSRSTGSSARAAAR